MYSRMSSVSSSYALVPRRQFIASMLFNTNIFQYSTRIDSSLATRGNLVIHPSATINNCSAGAILRENGKKLHSGTHPDLKDPTTNLQYTQLIGVYDVASGINGFINPDAPYFAVLNTDKSYQDDTAVNQVDASQNTPDNNWGTTYSANGQQILGPPVNTRGDISSEGFITGGQLHAVNLFHTPGYIVSGPESLILNPVDPITGVPVTYGDGTMLAQSNITSLANIYASNGVVLGSNLVALSNATLNTGNLTLTAGRLILNVNNSGTADLTTGNSVGGFRRRLVTASGCRATSQVFLTYSGINTPGFLSSENIANGSFEIVSSSSNDAGTVRWMVIN